LGPPGTKVLVNEKPVTRGSWAPHGTEGWYVGPSMDHYRSYNVYIPSTKSMRITDTLAWFPTQAVMPIGSTSDLALAAALDLTQALLHPSPASVLAPISTSHREALMQLAIIFGEISANNTDQPRVEDTQLRVEMNEEH